MGRSLAFLTLVLLAAPIAARPQRQPPASVQWFPLGMVQSLVMGDLRLRAIASLVACSVLLPSPSAEGDAPSRAGLHWLAIPSLALEASVPPTVRARGRGATAFLEEGSVQLRIEADNQIGLDSFLHGLESVPRGYVVEIKKKQRAADGGTVIYAGRWEGGPTSYNLYVRRRVGNLDVGCTLDAPDEQTVSMAESWCASLRPIAGRSASVALPAQDSIVRLRVAGGMSGRLEDFREIWSDGTVLLRGPGCDEFPGARRSVPRASVESLVDAFAAAAFDDSAAKFPSHCSDDLYTTVERRGPSGWASARFGTCSAPPATLVALVAKIREVSGRSPCAE